MKHVAIIGGGVAGLTCANALKRRGVEATVFEAASRIGGRDDKALYLLAPDLFRNTFRLVRELGLAGDLLSISPHAGQVYKGHIYKHRVASATGLLSFKGLNLADKALLPRMAYLLARHSSHLDFHHPERGLEFDSETVATFVKRELSQNILNYIAGPLISTLFFYGSDETACFLYLVLAKHMYNTRMSTIRGGLDRLTARLSEPAHIKTGRSVSSIRADAEGYIVDGERFSDVVVAVNGDAVLSIAGMDELLDPEDRQFFRDCRYQRTVSVTMTTATPIDSGCYAVSIPRVENFSAATISFLDYIDPSRGSLVRITGGGPDVTAASLVSDFERLYRVKPLSTNIVECLSGMPKFPPGRYRDAAAFQSRTRRPGLYFCGDYLLGPFVEAAITTGLRAAEAIQT